MNKREVIGEISQISKIDITLCLDVINSVESILSDELKKSDGIRNAFDKIYLLMNLIKYGEYQSSEQDNEFFKTIAIDSGASEDECIEIISVLMDILNQKMEISRSARFKFDTIYKLVNFFKSKSL